MALINLRNISLAFGGPPLFEDVSLRIAKGERICLLGRNGTGKSTLLKVISGEIPPDGGVIDRRQGLRVARLEQDIPRDLQGTIYESIAQGIGPIGQQLSRYHNLSLRMAQGEADLQDELSVVQQKLENDDGWAHQQRIEQVLSRLKLPADLPVASLSGGLKRRVLLARALAVEPEILLLDEPTNHLDIESIIWLEEFLQRENLTLVFVTHDRAFLRSLATRIVEIDRGRLFDFACDYDTFLERKEELLHAESQENSRFDKKMAEEEIWIRKGIKARRTRNEGRVRELKRMREEHRQRRERLGTARFNLQEAESSGKLVAEVKELTFAYDDLPVVKNFSTTVMRGDRIGIIGPNGVGKTTLLKLLLGELSPQQGSVRLGTNLQIIYFDQLREQLDPDLTVQQNLAGDQDTVVIGGRSRHVIGYLQDFLFSPDRIRSPVRILSGGERNRLLLARLFTREANVLVLDEPTNDLDLETLDLLEELLADFKGTLFLVSHDRAFLNRVVTSTIVFEDNGQINEYVGGYDDWLRQRPQPESALKSKEPLKEKPKKARSRKLTFKEKRELEALPLQIDALETEVAGLHAKMADPAFYRTAGEQVAATTSRLKTLEAELAETYARWEELDSLNV
ncbi:MAG: ATP-binding cassette domain-containing protein [Desulfuromonadales bacterium]|nr:ATP-binding cassette domain-containing protein [Desulfuromonadales bacterium]